MPFANYRLEPGGKLAGSQAGIVSWHAPNLSYNRSTADVGRTGSPSRRSKLRKVIAAAALLCMGLGGWAPAEARLCRNSHGKVFKCHKVIAPRINLKAKHPVKVQRCRGHVGRFNNCN